MPKNIIPFPSKKERYKHNERTPFKAIRIPYHYRVLGLVIVFSLLLSSIVRSLDDLSYFHTLFYVFIHFGIFYALVRNNEKPNKKEDLKQKRTSRH